MGGRPGYPDERPHGRYIGRSSGGFQGSFIIQFILHLMDLCFI